MLSSRQYDTAKHFTKAFDSPIYSHTYTPLGAAAMQGTAHPIGSNSAIQGLIQGHTVKEGAGFALLNLNLETDDDII